MEKNINVTCLKNNMETKEELKEKLESIQKELSKIQQEEVKMELEPIKDSINELLGDTYFCGVYMDKKTILQLLETMIDKNQPIFITYQLFKK